MIGRWLVAGMSPILSSDHNGLPTRLTSLEDLKSLARTLSLSIEASEDISILSESVRLGDLVASNSLAVHPMEGCDGDSEGRPGELTIRRYERFGAGGAALLWWEAIAVIGEARANPRQLWLNEKSRDSFAALIERTRAVAAEKHGSDHRPIFVAQLTHSGRYSRPLGKPEPLAPQPNPYRDAKLSLPPDWPVLTDEYLDRLEDAYVEAARLAFDVGFDAVDIKSCHGYLINDLLACHTRPGKYGGSFENRTRFLLDIIDRIHTELGQDKTVVTRLGICDATPYPYGWGVDREDCTRADLAEPKKLVALLASRNVPLINVTMGDPQYNPHCVRPFNRSADGSTSSPEHPLVGVCRLLDLTAEIQREFPDLPVVGSGYSWLGVLMPNVAAAGKSAGRTTFVGAGRLAFAYPDFASDILTRGRLDADKVCIACGACTQIMRDGCMTGCVVRDSEVYGPIYKQGRAR